MGDGILGNHGSCATGAHGSCDVDTADGQQPWTIWRSLGNI